jgi:acyl transferase domain-containing protein
MFSGWSVEEGLRNPGRNLSEALFWHPAVMACEWALVKTLEGILPPADAVIGHAGGEVMAALVGGALSLEDAAFLTYRQIELMAKAPPGQLIELNLDLQRVLSLAEAYDLILTGYNSPSSFVATGDNQNIELLLAKEDLQPLIRLVSADRPFHSPFFAPYQDFFQASLSSFKPSPSKITFISAKEGQVIPGEDLGPLYWRNHSVRPVRFDKAASLALDLGLEVFLDFSPNSVNLGAISEIAAQRHLEALTLPLSKKDFSGPELWAEASRTLEVRDKSRS